VIHNRAGVVDDIPHAVLLVCEIPGDVPAAGIIRQCLAAWTAQERVGDGAAGVDHHQEIAAVIDVVLLQRDFVRAVGHGLGDALVGGVVGKLDRLGRRAAGVLVGDFRQAVAVVPCVIDRAAGGDVGLGDQIPIGILGVIERALGGWGVVVPDCGRRAFNSHLAGISAIRFRFLSSRPLMPRIFVRSPGQQGAGPHVLPSIFWKSS
jgi:hypothetical protein